MAKQKEEDPVDFREKLSTVDQEGHRRWIYAHKPKGKLYNIRTISTIFYLALLFGMPFIKINSNPMLQFDVIHARFSIWGKIFLPQDAIILGTIMLVALLFIIVFTLIYGRVFCGWACPQTIFLEMVFRKIEYWIEGPANKQQMNDRKKWTTEMYIRKGLKHIIFFAISFIIANAFLSYIIGIEELFKIMTEPISQHVGGFVAILLFTFAFYAVFAFIREIVCIVVCPYGRLQSVLLDKNSILVAYDYVRGEPRERSSRNRTEQAGDCIDCDLCVKVCPTGIDIRNGTQLECVNCTACIDACNLIMDKVGLPPDLIKFASENNIEKGEKPRITSRIAMYSVALVVMLGLLTTLLVTRSTFDTTLFRVPGQTLQENPDGTISNLYRIKIVNKSNKTLPYHLEVVNPEAHLEYVGNHLDSLTPGAFNEETFFIKIPNEKISERKNLINIKIMSGEKVVDRTKLTFIGKY